MKLRHKLVLLFGAPIIWQITATTFLASSLARIDRLAEEETNAKKVVSLCLEVQGLLGQTFVVLSTAGLVDPTRGSHTKDVIVQRMETDFVALHELTQTNNKAKPIVEKMEHDCRRLVDRWQEMAEAVRKMDALKTHFVFAEFLTKDEYVDSLVASFHEVHLDTADMLAIYEPIAQDFRPQALKAREDFRFALGATIVAGLVFVTAIALSLNRNTLQRLQTLMLNMRAFSKGDSVIVPLQGDDELADLDKAFRTIAEERNQLEEIRKSMRAMVSHDLRSPLASMLLKIELLLDPLAESLPPSVESQLRLLDSELQRLNRLANTLLDIEKIEDGNLDIYTELLPATDVIGTAIKSVEAQADWKRITIKVSADSELMCFADRDRTIQVLVNLLSNAIKFTPKGSAIEIVAGRASNGRLRLEVIDSGPGVPVDQVGRLFGKFSQLEQAQETRKQGSGLGLYICKMLIHAQKGEVGYEPREVGSCFWFELPDHQIGPVAPAYYPAGGSANLLPPL